MAVANFDIGYVGPNQSSSSVLSTGTYSLSSRSNTPYVSLVGRSGFKKIFSWGEIVEVPAREMCTVKNESFHGGDIFINAGCDANTRPARITVPVPMIIQPAGDFAGSYRTEYPADVRLARRAYLVISDNTAEPVEVGLLLNANVYVVGKRYDGSHNTFNELVGLEPGSGYFNQRIYTIGMSIPYIPLGNNAEDGDDTRPHALLTTAAVFMPPDFLVLPPQTAYFTMEY